MSENQLIPPAPWVWQANTKAFGIDLVSLSAHRPTLMTFNRWGMRGAQPYLLDLESHLLHPASEFFIRPQSHNPWRVTGIDHPIARQIQAAGLLPEMATVLGEAADLLNLSAECSGQSFQQHCAGCHVRRISDLLERYEETMREVQP